MRVLLVCLFFTSIALSADSNKTDGNPLSGDGIHFLKNHSFNLVDFVKSFTLPVTHFLYYLSFLIIFLFSYKNRLDENNCHCLMDYFPETTHRLNSSLVQVLSTLKVLALNYRRLRRGVRFFSDVSSLRKILLLFLVAMGDNIQLEVTNIEFQLE
jgi:hypothetical protein